MVALHRLIKTSIWLVLPTSITAPERTVNEFHTGCDGQAEKDIPTSFFVVISHLSFYTTGNIY
jgi:hypothetical protein